VFTVRSIRGDWMKVVAKNAYPTKSPRARIEALADALGISRRSCYAYVAEERRVPEDVEKRFIKAFGQVPDDGWRTIDLYRIRPLKERAKKTRRGGGRSVAEAAEKKADWIERAVTAGTRLADEMLDHALEWQQNPITYGQVAMIEEGLDEQEARRKHPNNFDSLAMSEDVVAVCQSCGLIGAIDASVREINGMVFRVTCRTDSYLVSE